MSLRALSNEHCTIIERNEEKVKKEGRKVSGRMKDENKVERKERCNS